MKGQSLEERFFSKINKTLTCWLWAGTTIASGYGVFYISRVDKIYAHRFSYQWHKGKIKRGLFVLHKCDVPLCVNPAHLWVGTQADNNRDMFLKGRYAKGPQNGMFGKTHNVEIRKIIGEASRKRWHGGLPIGIKSHTQAAKNLISAIQFGKRLIKTKDLDPIYCGVLDANLDWNQRARLVLAYSCLYHLGASAYLSEFKGRKFWEMLQIAAINKNHDWPRGTERRHWRGENARKSAEYLWDMYYKGPEHAVRYWCEGKNFQEVSKRVQEIPSFGNWISFKIVDLLDRVLQIPIDLVGCDLNFYDEPRKGASLILHGDEDTKVDVAHAVRRLLKPLSQLKAPPHYERPLGILEAETCLCKFKAYTRGHYWIGKDIREIRLAMSNSRWGATAAKLLKAMPPEVTR